jgi:hypothetical protein
MLAPKPVSRVVIPSNTVLTSRVLFAALGKLPTCQIERSVQGLLDVLDCRCGNPDLEADVDFEAEIEEESGQPVVRPNGFKPVPINQIISTENRTKRPAEP